MQKLTIVQPYIPSYRVKFFTDLSERLQQVDIKLAIVSGSPPFGQADRGDAATLPFEERIRFRRLRAGRRSINLGGSVRSWSRSDGVILGLEGSSLDLYRAITRRTVSELNVGVWGHVGSFVNPPNSLDLALEKWQMKRVDHVFAYTPAGAVLATRAGVPSEHVTAVMNSVDTASLEAAVAELTKAPEARVVFVESHHLEGVRILSFIGGLDKSKRVSFLVEALEHLWVADPQCKILVAGKGSEEALFAPAVARGQVIMLGYADDRLKALIASVSEAFIMPGRVGLIAVEALLLRKPLLTTAWPYHSVELEYLREGSTRFTSSNDPAAFAALMTDRRPAQDSSSSDWTYPRLNSMVERFAVGVEKMMGKS